MNSEEKTFIEQAAAAIVQANYKLAAQLETMHTERMKAIKEATDRLERRTLVGLAFLLAGKIRAAFKKRPEKVVRQTLVDPPIPVTGEVRA